MQTITESDLLDRIRAFLNRHGMAPTTFGRQATGEPQLISSIEKGRSPSLKVVNRVLAFMDEHDTAVDLHAKLTAPPPVPVAEEDILLPFSQAPVSPTGGFSPISSPTAAPPTQSPGSGSCPLRVADTHGDGSQPNHSCSADADTLQ